MSETFPKTHNEFQVWIAGRIRYRPESVRVGQQYFNDLFGIREDIARALTGTDLDPFYLDYIPVKTLHFVRENW